jgi:hypothetical protein
MKIKQMRELKEGKMVFIGGWGINPGERKTFQIPKDELPKNCPAPTIPTSEQKSCFVSNGQGNQLLISSPGLKIPTSELPRPTKIETVTIEPNAEIVLQDRKFKNDKEREAFLADYKNWGLWLDIPALKLKVYRAELSDNSVILAFGTVYMWRDKECSSVKYKHWKKADEIRFDSYFDHEGHIIGAIRQDKLTVK